MLIFFVWDHISMWDKWLVKSDYAIYNRDQFSLEFDTRRFLPHHN